MHTKCQSSSILFINIYLLINIYGHTALSSNSIYICRWRGEYVDCMKADEPLMPSGSHEPL